MQMVIEISEEMYKDIQSRDWKNGELVFSEEWKAIHNGILLPKGHGRLVDADSMKTMKNIQSANFNAVELIRLWIDNQPTIIPADRSEI